MEGNNVKKGIRTGNDASPQFDEKSINDYLEKYFRFVAVAKECYRFDPYFNKTGVVFSEFRNSHHTMSDMTVHVTLEGTDEYVSFHTNDLDESISNMTVMLSENGLPTDKFTILKLIVDFIHKENLQLVDISSWSEEERSLGFSSVLYLTMSTNEIGSDKPVGKKLGPIKILLENGKEFIFKYKGGQVLEGFEDIDFETRYSMAFRLFDLDLEFIKENNEYLPGSWFEVFKGVVKVVNYEILDIDKIPVKCNVDSFHLISDTGIWHSLPSEALTDFNEATHDFSYESNVQMY